jgi:Skp family chaperone for outer membrane proteins
MKPSRRRATLALAMFLTAATPTGPRVGYVDLAQLVATHPLHAVLAQYDREIAALRSTQVGAPAAQAQANATALRRDASAAATAAVRANSTAAVQAGFRERAMLATVAASRSGAAASTYSAELVRETNADLTAYERAIGEQNDRAYAAREQQLREKESTLAFDLARANAGRRLTLRVKLSELHLTRPARAKLRGQLEALDAQELHAIRSMQRSDTAVLASYQRDLQRDGAAAIAAMAVRLRVKAEANLAIDHRIAQAQSSLAPMLSGLPARAEAFEASFSATGNVRAIVAGLRASSGDISQRFAALGSIASASQRDTTGQILKLEADRNALYRAIVAQTAREAGALARERHLDRVILGGSQPRGSIDLTAQTRAQLSAF